MKKVINKELESILIDFLVGSEAMGIEDTIYDTVNRIESLYDKRKLDLAYVASGWTWSEACYQLDDGKDPRNLNQAYMIDALTKALLYE